MNTCTVCILDKQNVNGKYNFLPFEKCAEHQQYFMKIDNFVPFGRLQCGSVIIQLMTELDDSNNEISAQLCQNRLESKTTRLFLRPKCTYFENI